MDIVLVPQLSDNYAYLIIDSAAKAAAVVDCAEAGPVLAEARAREVHLGLALATHHHFDHVGGHDDLLAAIPDLEVVGSVTDAPHIPGLSRRVNDGDMIRIGTVVGRAMLIPAHTSGHVAYYFPEDRAVFTGDTLFVGGCGRLFEGDAAQMQHSLGLLAALPDDTRVYCGHEYTEKNLRFALLLEPGNARLRAKLNLVEALRREGQPTIPSTIGEEKATNPFLRTDSPELLAAVGTRLPDVATTDRSAVFAALRRLKDQF